VLIKLCSAKHCSFAGDIQGIRKSKCFVMKLLNIIVIKSTAFFFIFLSNFVISRVN